MAGHGDFVMPPATTLTHDPCCSSHGARLDCEDYRRSHFVQVGPCCSAWAEKHPEYGTCSEPKTPKSEAPAEAESWSRLPVAWEGNPAWTQAKRTLSVDHTKSVDSSVNVRISDERAAVMPLNAKQARELAHELIIRADMIDPNGAA